jgi:hypothetical protein
MTRLPLFTNYQRTLESVRQTLRVLGLVRSVLSEEQVNELHFSTVPKTYGASTGRLKDGSKLTYDYASNKLIFKSVKKDDFTISAVGKNQKSLIEEVSNKLNSIDYDVKLQFKSQPGTTKFEFDKNIIKKHLDIQNIVLSGMDRARSHMTGFQTAISLWPHGFDLSFLWFREGHNEKKDWHMNFGFSPGLSEDQPYLYFYAMDNQVECARCKMGLFDFTETGQTGRVY